MKCDLQGTVKKIATFLGKNLSDKAIDVITSRTTFVNMSKDPKLSLENLPFLKKEFMGKGKVGTWKSWFTQEQLDYVNQRCKECFDPIGLKFNYA